MGLEDHVNLREAALPGGREGCANLRRMMAIVVDDTYSPDLAFELKPAVYATELRKRVRNLLNWDVQPDSSGNCGSCVQDVMVAGDLQIKPSQLLAAVHDFESIGCAGDRLEI